MVGDNVLVKRYRSVWYPYAATGYLEAFVVNGSYGLLTVLRDLVRWYFSFVGRANSCEVRSSVICMCNKGVMICLFLSRGKVFIKAIWPKVF